MPECHVLIRVQMPDRPGALGLVASRIGAVKGDIVGIEIVDRIDGAAVDELAVVLPDSNLVPVVIREIHEVDGAHVIDVVTVGRFPRPRLEELRWAAELAQATIFDDVAVRLRTALESFLRPRSIEVSRAGTGPGTQDTGKDTETFHLRTADIVVRVSRDSPLRPGERAIVVAYCHLADAWAPHLLGDPPASATA